MSKDPTNCGTCKATLERGWSSIYDAKGALFRSVCFDCAHKERQAEFDRTGVLTTSFMTHVCIDEARGRPSKAAQQVNTIQAAARIFEHDVWFGGLRAHLKSHPERGESLHHDGFKMLTFVMAGRVMITLEKGDASITLITLEDEDDTPRMGIQGICATEVEALALIKAAQQAWAAGKRTQPDGADDYEPARRRLLARSKRARGVRRRSVRSIVSRYMRESAIVAKRHRGSHARWYRAVFHQEMFDLLLGERKP